MFLVFVKVFEVIKLVYILVCIFGRNEIWSFLGVLCYVFYKKVCDDV